MSTRQSNINKSQRHLGANFIVAEMKNGCCVFPFFLFKGVACHKTQEKHWKQRKTEFNWWMNYYWPTKCFVAIALSYSRIVLSVSGSPGFCSPLGVENLDVLEVLLKGTVQTKKKILPFTHKVTSKHICISSAEYKKRLFILFFWRMWLSKQSLVPVDFQSIFFYTMEVSGDLWTLVCATEYKLKKGIVTLSQFRLFFSQLRVYIFQFWLFSPELHYMNLQFHVIKSELWYINLIFWEIENWDINSLLWEKLSELWDYNLQFWLYFS